MDKQIAKQAAAMATWIVIQVMERNPDYFSLGGREDEAAAYLDDGFVYAEQGRYEDAFLTMKKLIGKLLVQAPYLIKDDAELVDALGTLANVDTEYNQAAM